MQADMEAMVLAGDVETADLPECCNDLQTWAETGQLCKTGADCQAFVAWALVPALRAMDAAPSSDIPVALNAPAPSAQPGTPWRPPSAI